MPLFMDVHHGAEGLIGISPEEVAKIHARDLAVQGKHGVQYIKYWYDEATGKAFCLSRAPSKEAAMAVHMEAHGFMADEIFEVHEGE